MERSGETVLRVGEWRVDPSAGEISRGGERARVEVRTMRLLMCLAENAGKVVSIDELLDQVWAGVAVSPDSVYQAVTSLRRVLGDDAKQPAYIATVPRLGYRMVASVSAWTEEGSEEPAAGKTGERRRDTGLHRSRMLWFSGGAICLALVVASLGFLLHGKGTEMAAVRQEEKSIAVLPLLDLTEEMNEEPFADGMTEELIDKLSKIAGLRVASATSSFYFKGKQLPVGEMAKSLGVAYVLDGSVRKSGERLRVAVRLVRAENGYVIWSETYDRPFHDRLMVQDDIAGEVAKSLKASTEFKAGH